jgi:hypothetical protein
MKLFLMYNIRKFCNLLLNIPIIVQYIKKIVLIFVE